MCKMACHLMIRGKMAYKSCCLLLLSLTFCSKISETGCIDMSPFGHKRAEILETRLTEVGKHHARRASAGGYFLSACAQFKDEDGILAEWMDHYIAEGVEHFFLIDDGSSDGSHAVLEPYIHRRLVTLMVDVRKDHDPPISMVDRYNLLFKPFHYLTIWMIHVDLDEFVYGRQTSLADFLRNVKPTVGEIRIPWKQYGSSGYVHKPEASLVDSLLHRAPFNVSINMYLHTKFIFRAAALIREGTHFVIVKSTFISGFALMDGSVAPELPGWPLDNLNKPEWELLNDEEVLDRLGIHLNHYTTRYKDWFMAIKATRGIADREVSHYNEDYFLANDYNNILDYELAMKRS